ncbi:hypothetical protein BH18ACT7_BH18ACT7_01910 [soil metagenome]
MIALFWRYGIFNALAPRSLRYRRMTSRLSLYVPKPHDGGAATSCTTSPPDSASRFAHSGEIQKLTLTAAKSACTVESPGSVGEFLNPHSWRSGCLPEMTCGSASRTSSAIWSSSGQLNPAKKKPPSRPSAYRFPDQTVDSRQNRCRLASASAVRKSSITTSPGPPVRYRSCTLPQSQPGESACASRGPLATWMMRL